ncbi:MAG: Aspartate/glutamate/uridylate kinase [Piptocephalis tieghemiana]|nr:MAG: Aspartate/glutamate/uridylate kinase [Piptocephalis tieghemiana]
MGDEPISRPVSVNARHRDQSISAPRTIVLKLGTSSICDERTFMPRIAVLSAIVETVVHLQEQGHRVVLVSSGAVGMGLRSLGLKRKPTEMSKKRALAAIGQGRLLSLYDDLFKLYSIPISQVLLTRSDIADRDQYRNACNTLFALMDMGVVPIVNENDTISVSEIRFGDNDTLSGLVAGMIDADLLFILTDVDALYTDNPRVKPDAQIVRTVEDIATLEEKVSTDSAGSSVGTGGMTTKLVAADLATAAGVNTIISLGSAPERIPMIIEHLYGQSRRPSASPAPTPSPIPSASLTSGTQSPTFAPTPRKMSPPSREKSPSLASDTSSAPYPCPFTLFPATDRPLRDRKWWIRHGLHPHGTIYVDSGAVKGIIQRKANLFAAGILRSKGHYVAQQSVRIVWEEKNVEVARGIVNYASNEIERIIGHSSSQIRDILGYADASCIIFRDNIAREITPTQHLALLDSDDSIAPAVAVASAAAAAH